MHILVLTLIKGPDTMSEIIAILLAAFRTDAAEDFLRKELAPYIAQLSQFTIVLPLITIVSSVLLRANPTAQAEVTKFVETISAVLHDLSEPTPVAAEPLTPAVPQAAAIRPQPQTTLEPAPAAPVADAPVDVAKQ